MWVEFNPVIKGILGVVFDVDPEDILTASWREDYEEATDMKLPDGRCMGCRLRSHGIYRSFPHQFVLRLSRASGAKTEFEKILDGFCDLYFYGFVDEPKENIISWFIGDMDVFRREWFKHPLFLKWEDGPSTNPWYAKRWRAFWVNRLPADFIVACHNHPAAAVLYKQYGAILQES